MPTACPWEAHARRYRQRDWGKRSPVANRTGQAQNRGREGGGRGGSADDRHRRWTGTDESRLALRFYSLAGLGRSNGGRNNFPDYGHHAACQRGAVFRTRHRPAPRPFRPPRCLAAWGHVSDETSARAVRRSPRAPLHAGQQRGGQAPDFLADPLWFGTLSHAGEQRGDADETAPQGSLGRRDVNRRGPRQTVSSHSNREVISASVARHSVSPGCDGDRDECGSTGTKIKAGWPIFPRHGPRAAQGGSFHRLLRRSRLLVRYARLPPGMRLGATWATWGATAAGSHARNQLPQTVTRGRAPAVFAVRRR